MIEKLKDYLEDKVRPVLKSIAPSITEYKEMSHISPILGKMNTIENRKIKLKTLKEFTNLEPHLRENHIFEEDYPDSLSK